MNKSLYELGLEYEENIKQLQDTAKKVRLELKDAQKSFDKDRIWFLGRKLNVIYQEITDMRIIAGKLKNYYDGKEAAA